MNVIITSHAKKRLTQPRQQGIQLKEIFHVAEKIPGSIPIATRFRGFISTNGKIYDIVAKDIPSGRLIITVIGK
ncbi:hypothetical protein [Bacillus horti]|nr:hypothetical protein [Bacillus horti]